ncbi:Eco29kI family restriction endonuclease [Phenylobacterium sp.]|uniref:Eco29kI family restriction endonuclease n=1 Tax=Phenylobacterium sp. TaxID=1871053 RepID=UPI0025FE9BF9|nr:Eco29kI family restriction endonuclease [Phenylobacterium sp.]MBX3484778.1 Eco29kI family restriction endonuclease [Phenylobacterium sp.]MCW5758614.1 Eco29kI family restriction endonuclease [Phenylobacterium sp.]
MNEAPYNPLDRRNLGASVAEAMLERIPLPLGSVPRADGAGVYAIYYTGDFPLYEPIAAANRDDQWRWPIYVGKAIPAGGRKGGKPTDKETRPLVSRLREHAGSIRAVENLNIDDFYCRYLVVEDIWIPLGESLLIAKFSPIWNQLMDGFGNHAPGKGRHEGMRPRWDVIHPGRKAFDKLKPRPETAETIASEIAAYLRTAPVPPIRPRMLLDH